MDINLIISPFVGALIAGVSNRMAIKMLFFPSTQKTILGWKVPFTPGIIPKERERIARSIGETAGNYILNEDGIVKAFTSTDIEAKLKQVVRDFIVNLQSSDSSLKEYINELMGEQADGLIAGIKSNASRILLETLSGPALEDEVRNVVESGAGKLSEFTMKEVTKREQYRNLMEKLKNVFYDFSHSELFQSNISGLSIKMFSELMGNTKRISEYLSDSDRNFLSGVISSRSGALCDSIAKYLSNHAIRAKLNRYIDSSLSQSLTGRLLVKFVKTEKIYAYVYSEIINFLKSSKGNKEITSLLLHLFENIYAMRVTDLAEKLGLRSIQPSLQDLVSSLLLRVFTRENIEEMMDRMDSYLQSSGDRKLSEIADNLLGEFSILKLKLLIVELVKNVIGSPWALEAMENLISRQIDRLLEIRLRDIMNLSAEDIQKIQVFTAEKAKDLVINNAKTMLKFIDIPRITTERINELDIEEMEELILGIVRRDLWALTFLEASLGFIIGMLTPLLTYLFQTLF